MRSNFYGFYTPTSEEFQSLWERCIFVFDTNTLLNLYRYTGETYSSFLGVIVSLSERIWIPYKVADEFHKNRIKCISDQVDAYSEVEKAYNELLNKFSSKVNKYKQHKLIDIAKYKKRLNSFVEKEVKSIKSVKKGHPDYYKEDDVLNTVTELFENKIGERYSIDYLEKVYNEGEDRYSNKVPPGYMDADKSDKYRLYGDFLIWKDIINKAKTESVDVVFVTSDNKEDWWLEHNGRNLGPRPELLQEFKLETQRSIYIYNPAPFIKYASEFMDQTADDSVLSEIESVRREHSWVLEDEDDNFWEESAIQNYTRKIKHTDLFPPLLLTDINELLSREQLYAEDYSAIDDKIKRVELQLMNVDQLIASGVSDEDQIALEERRSKKENQVLDLKYQRHKVEDHLRDIQRKIHETNRRLARVSRRQQQEDVPF